MNATKIDKRVRLPFEQVIKFHLLAELTFFQHHALIPFDLDLLTFLALSGTVELPAFCARAARKFHPECPPEQFSTREQNIRNRLVKLTTRGFVVKSRPAARTVVALDPALVLPLDNNLLLDYQLLGTVPEKLSHAPAQV